MNQREGRSGGIWLSFGTQVTRVTSKLQTELTISIVLVT